MLQRVLVKNLEKPVQKELPEDVAWICESLGFTSGRDVENISSQTLLHLLELFPREHAVASEELAAVMHLSPGRVNYHVRNLIDSGFLYREKKRICLRAGSVKAAVEEIRKDVNRIFDDLSVVAEELDSSLGLRRRE